jgi:protein-S-isoprenylcysteine O-methyltransferase Ste14
MGRSMGALAFNVKVYLIFLAALVAYALILFVPAGTLDYWQAWIYLVVLFVPVFFIISYFLKKDPEFLKRRLKTKEKEAEQKRVIRFGYLLFILGFLIPGLDYRFGWSQVPVALVLAADALVFIGYCLVFLAFKENSYAARTVEVEKGQKVISTGPYAVVRHPMYTGSILLYLAMPIALGSYYALLIFMFFPVIIVYRIRNEEKVLLRDLPGYADYCKKTKYKLVPYVW